MQKKTAHYRRVVWSTPDPATLYGVLEECFGDVGPDTLPKFEKNGGGSCLVARRRLDRQPYFLHLVTYEAGAPAAVIEAMVEAGAVDPDTTNPPDGTEFIQSQLFCVIKGNHVVWTTHNTSLRDGSVSGLFYRLIEDKLGHGDHTRFELQAKLDPSAFRRAFRDGIEEIDLNLGDLKPTLEALVSDGAIPGMSLLNSLIGRRPTDREIRAAANVSGRITLRPGRNWDKPQVKELMARMASNVLDDHEDQFVIVTKGGLRLTREKMSVHKEYRADGSKHLLDPADVERKLRGVLNALDEAGLLEDEDA